MLLFAAPPFSRAPRGLLARASARSARFRAERFANGEMHLTLGERVRSERCVVLGTIAPPDVRLLTLLLLCHTLRKEGAREIVALLPYLAYSRHDKDEERISLGAAWTGALLRASGVVRVVTFDVHSARAASLLGIPIQSLSPAEAFAKRLRALGLVDACLVAPDDGARSRCEAVARAARLEHSIVRVHKRRTEAGIVHLSMEGSVEPRAIVVDDMLDTGGTLVSCCRELRRAGAREIVVMVTHGLFTGSAWRELWSIGVREIHCTDTVPLSREARSRRIHVVPIVASAASCVRASSSRRVPNIDSGSPVRSRRSPGSLATGS